MAGAGPRLLAPEVIQTSAMDCGPAALKCLLDGFGLPVNYGRLREACQTDIDGTSIDTIEEVANQLGLEAHQVMLPPDHLLLPETAALPALAVVVRPNGLTHFLVIWRRVGGLVQLMDPAVGRRWTTSAALVDELYVHDFPVAAADWRDYAGGEEFLGPLRRRLAALGLGRRDRERLIDEALADESWRSLAALDAAVRLTQTLVDGDALYPGRRAVRMVERLAALGRSEDAGGLLPDSCWSARRGPDGPEGEDRVTLRGAVLVRAVGLRSAQAEPEQQPLPPDLAAGLTGSPSNPGRVLLSLLRADGLLAPGALLAALALAAAGTTVEAALFLALFGLGPELSLVGARWAALAALLIFICATGLLEWAGATTALRLGRRLEGRLRMAFLAKIPLLGDRYFSSRPVSDMAERSHLVHTVRQLPEVGAQLLRAAGQIALTAAGIAWLDPAAAPVSAGAAALAVGIPLFAQPILAEREMRLRVHVGGLGRFCLDTLLGLVAICAHGAERAVRREHEVLLLEWARALLHLQRAVVSAEAAQFLVGFSLAAWILADYLARNGPAGSTLLLAYWALSLPMLGQELALAARQYPTQRNVTLRLIEPLGAPEVAPDDETELQDLFQQPGVRIGMQGVAVRAGGHVILDDLDMDVGPGQHVAIVGPSGSGKSSLVGLLLGWHRPSAGSIQVNGQPLDGPIQAALRRHTAWVDPAVQLWNRSLLANLTYGAPDEGAAAIPFAIASADLRGVLERLTDGLQTSLGESGALVSGGEGQRVRMARALCRPDARLVVLDEPFRGLDRATRRSLLTRARQRWWGATLLCITHDVGETREFDRVLVVENGRVTEDGNPAHLLARPNSRYGELLAAEAAVRTGLWSSGRWRRLWLEGGRLRAEHSGGRR